MKTQMKWALGLCLLAAIGFTSCSKDSGDSSVLGIKSVAITNAGVNGTTRVEGVLTGDTFAVTVPALSDLSALTVEIVPEQGSTTTPATGTTLDFTQNDGVQNVVASLGTQTKTFKIKVTAAALQNEAALLSFDVAGVSSPKYTINHAKKSIVLEFTNVLGTKATLSNFKINPESATITGVPAISDKGEMVLDFSDATAKTITVAMGSQTITYTVTANISEAGLKASTANVSFDQSLSTTVPAEVGTNATRSASFDGRYVFYASRVNGNHIYYYDTQDATKTQKELDMTGFDASNTVWGISDVRVADNGKIYACSMANAAGKFFRIWRWDSVTAAPVKVLDYAVEAPIAPSKAVRLGDAFSILGDPSTDGYIVASNFPFGNALQAQLYIWKVVAGKVQDVVVKDYVGKFTGASATDTGFGQYGRVSAIPDGSGYIVTGTNVSGILLDKDWNFAYEMPRELPVQGRAQDMNLFEFNGVRYLSYTVNREWAVNDAFVEIVALTDGDNYIDGLKGLANKSIDNVRVYKRQITTTATKAAVWVSATNKAKVVDSKVRVFGYVCEYGVIVVDFTK